MFDSKVKIIGIIIAMQKEFSLLEDLLQSPDRIVDGSFHATVGNYNDMRVILALSGIGKVSAAVCTVEVIRRFNPDYLVNTGVSGALAKNLKVMDTVVSTEVCYHDVSCGADIPWGQVQGYPLYYKASEKLLNDFKNLERADIHRGLICCGDHFLSSVEEFNFIRRTFPQALAVDMESAAIAQTAYLYGVPFIAIRIISDIAGEEDNYSQYRNFWKEAPLKSFETIKLLLNTIK